jgi:hypothetical protein
MPRLTDHASSLRLGWHSLATAMSVYDTRLVEQSESKRIRTLVHAIADRRIVNEANSRKILLDEGKILSV